jgi:hypothetical protein
MQISKICAQEFAAVGRQMSHYITITFQVAFSDVTTLRADDDESVRTLSGSRS